MTDKTATVVISRRLAKEIERVLGNYSMTGFYMPPRTGGILAGCPRGNPPTPAALAYPAKELYKRYLEEVSPQWHGPQCDCGRCKAQRDVHTL